MSTIREIYDHEEFPAPFGVEVEMEYADRPKYTPMFQNYWKVHGENSLRGYSDELVTNRQVNWDNLPTVFDSLHKNFGVNSPHPTHRASTHIHINMQEKTPTEVLTAAVAFWWAEPLLATFCGEQRKGNNFSLSLSEAPGILTEIKRGLFYKLPLGYIDDGARYGSLNLGALSKFGSLEFRSMRATTDTNLIDRWLKMCYAITRVSEQFKNPALFMDEVFRNSPTVMLEAVTGDVNFVDLHTLEETKEATRENLGLLSSLVYDSDWVEAEEEPEVPTLIKWAQDEEDALLGAEDLEELAELLDDEPEGDV